MPILVEQESILDWEAKDQRDRLLIELLKRRLERIKAPAERRSLINEFRKKRGLKPI